MNLSAIKNMKISTVGKVATKTFGRSSLVVRKYSPEILTGVGIAGVVTSAVLASKATLQLEPVVQKVEDGLQNVAYNLHHAEHPEYDEKSAVRDKARVYVTGALDISKLYMPSVTLGLASIACIVGAHGIMRKRNVALVAAYKTLEQGFGEYRKRVMEELGEDKDRDFRAGLHDEKTKNKETGKVKTVTSVDPNGISGYARFFDEGCQSWSKTPEYNLAFLKAQQNYANDMLHARGHVFLNEVYDMLGMERSEAGSIAGWVISKDGDNFVDFGIYNFNSPKAREFVNGHERSILLDFNVDGVIFDLI